jgi:TolA-binding protein
MSLLATGLVLASCLGRSESVETETTEGSSVSSSLSLLGTSAEALIDRGKAHVLEGNYREAEVDFQAAYAREGADPEHRAEALFELGELYSNLLNPGRDREMSLRYFSKLREEFPDSRFAQQAEEYLQKPG